VERAVKLHRRLHANDHLKSRVTCLEDYTHQDWDRMTVFRPSSNGHLRAWHDAPLEARMKVFAKTAEEVATQAFAEDGEAPGYMVQVSCTGYDAPTAAQKVASKKGWQRNTRLLVVGHLGCYAALPVSSMATDLLLGCERKEGREAARVSILHCELCTLHVRLDATDFGQIIQQRLFADGAIRLDATLTPRPGCLAFLDSFEVIVPDTGGFMSWSLADGAFEMYLAQEVPGVIQESLRPVVGEFLGRHGLEVEDVSRFAIHPGGPRIIQAAAKSLGLGPEAIAHSLQVFGSRGNMSSATLPHIWHAMSQDPEVEDGELICSLAFGPGLTVAGNLLRKGE
jgi:predicted naringenin-chalcone synthase